MRTAVLLSAMILGDAIRGLWAEPKGYSGAASEFLALILIAAMIMDVVDFARG